MKKEPKNAPRPSTLLSSSLDLLDNGKLWIKGHLHKKVVNPRRINHVTKMVKEEAHCMVGACNRVNTPRQREAMAFLALAINPNLTGYDYSLHRSNVPLMELKRKRDRNLVASDTIINFNDKHSRQFKEVRAVFKKAMRLAKAAHA